MALGVVSKYSKIIDYITVMDTVPYISLIDILKNDISEMSDKKYTFEEIRNVISKRKDDENYCKNYIKEIYNDIYENITNKGIVCYGENNNSFIINELKSIQYDFNRLLGFIKGDCYILKLKGDKPDINDYGIDFSMDISENFLDECKYMVLCIQLENNKFSNLIFELGEAGINGNLNHVQQHINEPMYRLSVSAIDNNKIILLSEYEFFKSEYNRMFSLTKSGCKFCGKECPDKKNNIKIAYTFDNENQFAKFGYDYYCEIREDYIKDKCVASTINPFNVLGMMSYAYDKKHTNSDNNIDMRANEKKYINTCDVRELVHDDDFVEYKILSMTPNYYYGNNEYQGGTHASPITHYRRGVNKITNKYGTTYSRKGTMVNNHIYQEAKVIYKTQI